MRVDMTDRFGRLKRNRPILILLVAALATGLGSPPSVYADTPIYHSGHITVSNQYRMLQGYIRLSGTVPLTSHQMHASWINFCPGSSCDQWVQVGSYQGF